MILLLFALHVLWVIFCTGGLVCIEHQGHETKRSLQNHDAIQKETPRCSPLLPLLSYSHGHCYRLLLAQWYGTLPVTPRNPLHPNHQNELTLTTKRCQRKLLRILQRHPRWSLDCVRHRRDDLLPRERVLRRRSALPFS